MFILRYTFKMCQTFFFVPLTDSVVTLTGHHNYIEDWVLGSRSLLAESVIIGGVELGIICAAFKFEKLSPWRNT